MEKILAKLLRNLLDDDVKRVEYETEDFKIVAYRMGKVYRIDLKRK